MPAPGADVVSLPRNKYGYFLFLSRLTQRGSTLQCAQCRAAHTPARPFPLQMRVLELERPVYLPVSTERYVSQHLQNALEIFQVGLCMTPTRCIVVQTALLIPSSSRCCDMDRGGGSGSSSVSRTFDGLFLPLRNLSRRDLILLSQVLQRHLFLSRFQGNLHCAMNHVFSQTRYLTPPADRPVTTTLWNTSTAIKIGMIVTTVPAATQDH